MLVWFAVLINRTFDSFYYWIAVAVGIPTPYLYFLMNRVVG